MLLEPLQIAWTLAHGETLDRAIDVPLDYAPAPQGEAQESPLEDGSSFTLGFVAARGAADSDGVIRPALRFEGQHEDRALTVGEFLAVTIGEATAMKLTLAFQATQSVMLGIPPGTYVGDLIHHRPRPGPLGPQRNRAAVVTLTIEGGTGS